MQSFKVLVHIFREQDRDPDPEDSWDRGDTSAMIEVRGVAPVKDSRYFDVVLPSEFDPSKKLFLLWADYDTGDSFGRDGNQFEAIDLFHDYDAACAAKKALQSYRGDVYSGDYVRDDGGTASVHLPWNGYFEYLNALHVQEVPVCDEPL